MMISARRERWEAQHAVKEQARAMSLSEFNAALDEAAKKLPAESIKPLQQKIALEALSRIVLRTAVDTGRARGNWQTTINQVPLSEVEEPKNTQQVLEDGTKAIEQVPDWSVIHITNNVPYIIYLEDGSSRQAPQGMVGLTVTELQAMFA